MWNTEAEGICICEQKSTVLEYLCNLGVIKVIHIDVHYKEFYISFLNPLFMGLKVCLLFTGGGGEFTLPTFFITSQAKMVQNLKIRVSTEPE